ncbi:MAG: hypothetical protein HY720_10295 [Planctomycetes bacterium]|nr:hypothetical protein [Planctomycetota bacterium]
MPRHHVFRWDLDKTYLQTPFESLRGLVRTFFESAGSKVAYPGAAPVLRGIARRPGHHLYILSGSPKQMAKVLYTKLALDGVEPEEMTLKPSLEHLLKGRFRAIREQMGYKLPALLESRTRAPVGSAETLVGDDAELDPLIYSLYADLLARRIGAETLELVLAEAGVEEEERETARANLGLAPPDRGVERILIRLARETPPAELSVYGRRLVPVRDYFQIALLLFEAGRLGPVAVAEAARDVAAAGGGSGVVAESGVELVQRGAVEPAAVRAWLAAIPDSTWEIRRPLLDALELAATEEDAALPPSPDTTPDYLALYRSLRASKARVS